MMMDNEENSTPDLSDVYPNLTNEDPELANIMNLIDPPYLSVSGSGASPSRYFGSSGSRLPGSHNSPADERQLVPDDFVETCLEGLGPDEINSDEDEQRDKYRRMDEYYPDCEPEILFSPDEEQLLQQIVEQHNERYRSVNFGEELIKVKSSSWN